MKDWIVRVVAAALIFILSEVLLVEGKVKKYVVGFLKLALVLCIISPVFQLFSGEFDLFSSIDNNIKPVDDGFVESVLRRRYDLVEKNLERGLEQAGYEGVDVSIDLYFEGEVGEIQRIRVDFQNAVINGQKDNTIIIAEVKKTASAYLGVGEEKTEVYGLPGKETQGDSG